MIRSRALLLLLEADPHLEAYSRLAPDIRERENFFIANSLRGMTADSSSGEEEQLNPE